MIDETKIKAIGPWVFVEIDPPPSISKGGIILPDGNTDTKFGYATGRVISAGKGCWHQPKDKTKPEVFHRSEVVKGMKIYFRRFIQDAHKLNPLSDRFSFIHQDDVLLEVIG
jgi:co-chaperonin GroES (HSP10)